MNMAKKILVDYPGNLTDDTIASKRKKVADALGVCCDDVIIFSNLGVSIVDVPDDLVKAREKADKEAADAAEKAAKEAEAAAAGTATPAAPVDYESWTVEQLHAEAAKRDLHGRSGLDKAGLVKALQKDDKKG